MVPRRNYRIRHASRLSCHFSAPYVIMVIQWQWTQAVQCSDQEPSLHANPAKDIRIVDGGILLAKAWVWKSLRMPAGCSCDGKRPLKCHEIYLYLKDNIQRAPLSSNRENIFTGRKVCKAVVIAKLHQQPSFLWKPKWAKAFGGRKLH